VAVLAGQARHDIGPKTLRLDRRSAAMCGIVGAISAKPIDSRTIAEMRDSMASEDSFGAKIRCDAVTFRIIPYANQQGKYFGEQGIF